ncbi:MAG: hypothetical protein AAF481_10775 [Acidobacteriota bacterium]
MADNNPFVIDGTVIDQNTFSRNDGSLPVGQNYIASANRGVADALGFSDTQAVMYSFLEPGMWCVGLAADDVNMVRMGMTGSDHIAGNADDYTVVQVFETDCSAADVLVRLSDFFLGPGQLGACLSEYENSFAQPPSPIGIKP